MSDLVIMKRPNPTTLGDLAAQSVENAKERLACAAVDYAGALQRQQMISAAGKSNQPLTQE